MRRRRNGPWCCRVRHPSAETGGKFGSLLLRPGLDDLPPSSTTRTDNGPALRRERQKRKATFFGGWDSPAVRWLAAAQPRSEAGVLTYAALTERTFQFVYAQAPRSGGERRCHGAGCVLRPLRPRVDPSGRQAVP